MFPASPVSKRTSTLSQEAQAYRGDPVGKFVCDLGLLSKTPLMGKYLLHTALTHTGVANSAVYLGRKVLYTVAVTKPTRLRLTVVFL